MLQFVVDLKQIVAADTKLVLGIFQTHELYNSVP